MHRRRQSAIEATERTLDVFRTRKYAEQLIPLRALHNPQLAVTFLKDKLDPGATTPDYLIGRFERPPISNRYIVQAIEHCWRPSSEDAALAQEELEGLSGPDTPSARWR